MSAITAMACTPGTPTQIGAFDRVTASLTITEGRLAVACSKYDKGSTYVGWGGIGLLVAVGATSVSKARAAGRRRGKMLVGHVRYDWLKLIEVKGYMGGYMGGYIVAVLSDPTSANAPELFLRLNFGRQTDVLSVARNVIRSAAVYRSKRSQNTQERRALEQCAASPQSQRLPDGTMRFALPIAISC